MECKCGKEGKEVCRMAHKVAYKCECGNVWEIVEGKEE